MLAVLAFLVSHLPDDGAAAMVVVRQTLQVTGEMFANLVFGFGDETEAPFVAQHPTGGAHHEGAGIPERAQTARPGVELGEPLFAPREVVQLLIGRLTHLRRYLRVPGDGRVPLVEALGRDFARVIDPHQAGGVGAGIGGQLPFGGVGGRILARRLPGRRRNRAQRIAGAGQNSVQRSEVSVGHACSIAMRAARAGKTRKHGIESVYSAADFRRSVMKLSNWILPAALVLAAPALAHEAAEEGPTGPWAGKVNLGYLATSGNTENSNLNAAFEISYTADVWTHKFDARATNATEDEETSAEGYAAGWKSELELSDASFLFGRLDWRKDRFSGYDQQFSQTLGYGRKFIDTERHTLNGEAGAGARQSDLGDGTTESETIVTAGVYYVWNFSETAAFTQDLRAESGADNTYTESKTAISAELLGDLALVASYTVKNNTDVPPGTEKTDTFTAISLEYRF